MPQECKGGGKEERLGFTISPRRCHRVGPINITDLNFADDIVLLSDTAAQAQELLNNVKNAALCVGLHMNAKKTQFTVYNQPTRVEIHTVEGSCSEEVNDFEYLGSWVRSIEWQLS